MRALPCVHGKSLSRCVPLRALALAGGTLALSLALAACGPERTADLGGAQRDYASGEFDRALAEARAAASRSQGEPRDRARYIEGLSLLRLGRPREAIEPLRDASDAADRSLAADACVSLGTAQVRCEEFGDAAQSYRRAALLSDGAESRRAHSIAARCFDAAGQTALADASRDAAGEPRRPQPQPSPAIEQSEPTPAPSTTAVPAAKPPLAVRPAEPRRTVTADDKPSTESAPSIAPIRFAIQAGAFRSAESAASLASQLEPSCRDLKLAPPRVIATDDAKGSLYLVQFGDFPNRGAATKMLLKFPRSAYRVERRLDDAVTQADSP